jgi:nucleoside-diphosphate-sugar epimerase
VNRVLVTGATGFVGRTLCGVLADAGYVVRAALRSPADTPLPATRSADQAARRATSESVIVGDISGTTVWGAALEGVDVVIHAAARAHRAHDTDSKLYFATNGEGTACLARAAVQSAVSRFIYLSTVKVNGEETHGRAYSATDEPHPVDIYGKSKLLGEQSLLETAAGTGMTAAIVRSPLVYGPEVRANFLRLMRLVDRQRPLPLGAVRNRRSLVSIWNLCDLLANLIRNPAASGIWMVSDGEDLSTPELIRRIAAPMRRKVRLLAVPVFALQAIGVLTGRQAEINRLCGSLAVDLARTRDELGWSPPVSVDEGLTRTVSWYLSAQT